MSVKVLCEKWPGAENVFLEKCRNSLELMLESKAENERFESESANRLIFLDRKSSSVMERDLWRAYSPDFFFARSNEVFLEQFKWKLTIQSHSLNWRPVLGTG